ncbi:MAG: galactosyldiacylglycerol synthase [Chloroflexi bacterium]|nr:galactosyldiacylglycerol synthase [Chloroflexota bacterium]
MKILILFSDTGGGHRSAAEAIISAYNLHWPGQFESQMVDFLNKCIPPPLNRGGNLYRPTVNSASWLWGFLWRFTNHPYPYRYGTRMMARLGQRRMRALIVAEKPDVVVSVHPLANHLALSVLATIHPRIPYVIVVTDLFSAHRTWYHPKADLIVVPTTGAYDLGLQYGISPERLKVTGLPVHERFLEEINISKVEMKARLGLPTDKPVVLLISGGEGMGPVFSIAQAVAHSGAALHLVVIAGRNAGLKAQLEKTNWPVSTTTTGFVRNMHEWMRAADLLITKAGPGTISEALISGLPMILFDYIPGQEEGNVTFVVETGAGRMVPIPVGVGETVYRLLQPSNPELQRIAQAAQQQARPLAARDTADLIAQVAMKSMSRVKVREEKAE